MLFYTASDKEILKIRKEIFLERGIPALYKKGFVKAPFSGSLFGWHPGIGHLYQLCRISDSKFLEMVSVDILRGDRWIQVGLNIFKLTPAVDDIEQLQGLSGIQYSIPPNSLTSMRLHSDDIRGIPLFSCDFMADHHKLKYSFTKNGFEKQVNKLSNRIEKDLNDIDFFIKRWHELYSPIKTTWEGFIEGFESMTLAERLAATGLTKRFENARKKDKEETKRILKWLKVDDSFADEGKSNSFQVL
ncbi:hypothetical protein FAZ15_01310 [Sphingobacterium olei]|uniref:Uncharacterized protein n=1 Tax=Sphingobacterium olei TaxID=2571155 RepID=A0A4U0P688_9SPHI|nr:hypothetical protein [Sphingobacterium olei]TJZ62966.1 hypothetical protein FAZ15_01310 [Sphingobacterium olei]